ncbi:MAG: SDR family NAD(P)-dependent oxidoreductase [Bacteroidota bacterium]|nr:SDR family NAD(P)-dependent oxidoreductase [Bacteroidota bacterium]
MRNITGKTFIVTGANRGIGKVIAKVFLMAGASVILSGRNKERLEAVRLEFIQMGFSPLAIHADLTIPEECEQLVSASLSHFGKIDGLINNAGLPMRGRFEKMSAELFAEVVNANMLTAANCTKSALPELIKTQGSVVFISSVADIHGLPNASPYCAAKMGLRGFSESLRMEMHRHKVHVGLLRLGLVDPPPEKTVLRDDGTYKAITSKGHQSQESAARAILRMVRKRKRRITMTPVGKILSLINWIAPWLLRFIVTRMQYSAKYNRD